MTPDVVKVQAFSDFTLEAQFADGALRRFDVTRLLGYPAFSALREGNLFLSAKVQNGSVTWTDEIAISPDTLCLRGEPVSQDDNARTLIAA